MTDNPRRWFQIHLSTAIALTLVAGGLLALNMIRDPDAIPTYGYPYPFYEELLFVDQRFGTPIRFYDPVIKIGPVEFHFEDNGISYGLLAIDAAFAALLLSGTTVAGELIARRRERGRP